MRWPAEFPRNLRHPPAGPAAYRRLVEGDQDREGRAVPSDLWAVCAFACSQGASVILHPPVHLLKAFVQICLAGLDASRGPFASDRQDAAWNDTLKCPPQYERFRTFAEPIGVTTVANSYDSDRLSPSEPNWKYATFRRICRTTKAYLIEINGVILPEWFFRVAPPIR